MTTTPAKSDAELLYDALVEENGGLYGWTYLGDFNGYSELETVIDGHVDLKAVAAIFLRLRAEQEAAR